jgi:glycosyltransferase involved in cell wall biosynthesis
LKHITPGDFKHKVINNIVAAPEIVDVVDVPEYGAIDPDAFIVLSVMRLSEEKRPQLFLDVCKRFYSQADIKFLLVGDGPMAGTLEKFIAEESPPNFCWIRQSSNVGSYYNYCSLYLMTSRVEGSPNSVLEASLMGRASIVADVGGVSEIFEDKVSAVFVKDLRDAAEYARAIEDLFNNRQRLHWIGKNARLRVEDLYSGRKTAVALLTAVDLFANHN